MDTNDFSLLRTSIEQFVKLPDEEWDLLLPHLEYRSMGKNGLLAQEGKRAHELGFITAGFLRQFYTKDGEEKTTYFFFENEFAGAYISCITGQPSLITIEALSKVEYISFSYEALHSLFDKSMSWQKFGRLMAEYLTIGLEDRMVSLLLQSPEERYVALLNNKRSNILARVPQHYVANYLGITPVSMSRIRNRLVKGR